MLMWSSPARPLTTSVTVAVASMFVSRPWTAMCERLLLPNAALLDSTMLSLPAVPVTVIVLLGPLMAFVKQTPSFAHVGVSAAFAAPGAIASVVSVAAAMR